MPWWLKKGTDHTFANPDDLNSIPEAHVVEGETLLPQVVLCPPQYYTLNIPNK